MRGETSSEDGDAGARTLMAQGEAFDLEEDRDEESGHDDTSSEVSESRFKATTPRGLASKYGCFCIGCILLGAVVAACFYIVYHWPHSISRENGTRASLPDHEANASAEDQACSDNDGTCGARAARGECLSNPTWMLSNCRKTCLVCNKSSTCVQNSTRGERLCRGELKVLYHQTDREACVSILEGGFDMTYTSPGNLGYGTYFCDEAWRTGYKARSWGCVVKALVRLGNVLDLGHAWLQDVGRLEDTCNPVIGYKLAESCGDGYDSIYTTKHGEEYAIFFIDQVVDMIAYHTTPGYYNDGQPTGYYVNDRRELKWPDACEPRTFGEVGNPPACKSPKPSAFSCQDHFEPAKCAIENNGNVANSLSCIGVSDYNITYVEDQSACESKCLEDVACKAIHYEGWQSKKCLLYGRVPDTRSTYSSTTCLRKVV